uniref:Uncharacterized protein n=1 Tax=Anas platyrhynchos TaxID=8839 RepID=A0A8B9T4K2_ANAPL
MDTHQGLDMKKRPGQRRAGEPGGLRERGRAGGGAAGAGQGAAGAGTPRSPPAAPRSPPAGRAASESERRGRRRREAAGAGRMRRPQLRPKRARTARGRARGRSRSGAGRARAPGPGPAGRGSEVGAGRRGGAGGRRRGRAGTCWSRPGGAPLRAGAVLPRRRRPPAAPRPERGRGRPGSARRAPRFGGKRLRVAAGERSGLRGSPRRRGARLSELRGHVLRARRV